MRPQRTEGGFRLYSDADVQTLRAMTALVDAGVPAARAAETVREHGPREHDPLTDGGASVADHRGELVAAAASLSPEALDRTLDRAFASGDFDAVIDQWLGPELVALGQAWSTGEIAVLHEHFAAAGVLRSLSTKFAEARGEPEHGTVLVGLPAGARHELMPLAFATSLRRRGTDVVYLGADVPLTEWIKSADVLLPRAIVLSVGMAEHVPAAQAVVDALSARRPPTPVLVGGTHRGSIRGAESLPNAVGEAADRVHQALRAGAL